MNAPSSDSEKAAIASSAVQLLNAPALFRHGEGVQQGSAGKPWHERGILHRVPEPPATPAQLVVRPPASECDPDGQERPRHVRPGSGPTRPGRVQPPADERRYGEGERHRQNLHSPCREVADARSVRSPEATDSGPRPRPARWATSARRGCWCLAGTTGNRSSATPWFPVRARRSRPANRRHPRLTAQVQTPMINVHRRNEPSCAPQVALIR